MISERIPESDAWDDSIERMWNGIRLRRTSAARRRHVIRIAGALAFCVISATSISKWKARTPSIQVATAGPLHTAIGLPIGELDANDEAQNFAFDDASHVELSPHAHLASRTNDAASFVTDLTGSATFDVTPGGPRRWTIHCGLVTVDVIGTRFTVVDTSNAVTRSVRVSVEHGIVLVRGENVPDHLKRLVDGESIDVVEPHAAQTPTKQGDSASSTIAIASPTPISDKPIAVVPSPSWHDLANRGEYADAYRELGPNGFANEAAAADVDELLALADVARLSAHPRDAIDPLSRVVNAHRSDPRAPLAAFTIGRVDLDTLNDPASAARAFQQAIDLGLPDALVDDAYTRLAEADVKAADKTGARAARDACAAKHAECSQSSAMKRWVTDE